MKKYFFSIGLILFTFFYVEPVLAQNNSPASIPGKPDAISAETEFKPIIKARRIGKINEELIFDASTSIVPKSPKEELISDWDFGDGNREQGSKVSHAFNRVGNYKVVLTLKQNGKEMKTELNIFIYDRLILLFTNRVQDKETITSLINYAQDSGIYLKLVESYGQGSDFLSEEVLAKKLPELLDDLQITDQIVVWTKSSVGLTFLSRLKGLLIQRNIDLSNKNIISIGEVSFNPIENVAKNLFKSIKPARIILTKSEALWLLDAPDIKTYLARLAERGISYRLIDQGEDQLTIKNSFSFLIGFMMDRGIPSNTLKLVLILPIIATVVAFMKQVIGMNTMGVYTPSIITLSFMALDLRFGLIILLVLLVIGTLARFILSRYRLLYIPRMSILLTIASLTIFAVLAVGAYFNLTDLVSISIFPMLMMSTLVEKFVTTQTEQGLKSALILIFETLLVAIICYFVAEWDWIKTMVFGYPELIFVFILANIFLGRWTGLRLFEYFRFYEVIKHAEEE